MSRELQTLDRQPFQETIDTVFFFSGGGRGEIIDEIKTSLSQSVSLVLLTGSEGSGKTMACRMVEKELPPEMISIFLPQAINSFDDMANIVLQEIGLNLEEDEQEADAPALLEKIVTALQVQNRRLVVFFDEAEKIYLATLERVRKLLDQVNEQEVVFQFVFSGRQAFEENLQQLSMVTFKDVEERRYTLHPLNEVEACQYLNHCMKIASGEDDAFFSQDLVSKVSASGTNFKRLNQFALEAFQADQLDTSFLNLLDYVEEDPTLKPEEEMGEDDSSTPARKGEVNLEFLTFRKILPTWILYGGGVSIITLFLFFWFGYSGDSEQPEDVTSDVPIIELKRVVPVNPPPSQDSVAETEKPAEPEVPEPVEVPAEPIEPVRDELSEETPVEQAEDKGVEVPTGPLEPVRDELSEEKPVEQAEDKPVEESSESVITGVEEPPEKKPDVVEEQITPVQVMEEKTEAAAVVDKSAETGVVKIAEDMSKVMVEPLEEKEAPFSVDAIKETKLPELPQLPETIIIIGDEKKFKDSKEARKRTIVEEVPAQGTFLELSDKGVDALFLKRIAAGARWLVGGGGGKYTIQLMVLTSDQAEESLKKMLRTPQYQSVANQLYVLRRTGPDPTVMAFYGEYPSLAAARNGRNNLPVFLRKHHPYAISVFGAVEKATAPQ